MRVVWRTQALDDLRACAPTSPAITRPPPTVPRGTSAAPSSSSPASRIRAGPAAAQARASWSYRHPYFVAYRVRAGTVRILRVMHGGRRWP